MQNIRKVCEIALDRNKGELFLDQVLVLGGGAARAHRGGARLIRVELAAVRITSSGEHPIRHEHL